MAYIVLKTLSFPEQLHDSIQTLAAASLPDDLGRKKAFILNRALNSPVLAQSSPATQVLALAGADLQTYKVEAGKKPAYLATTAWTERSIVITNDSQWYTYQDQPKPDEATFWADFSNVRLGGGLFGSGFAQEEVMCCETPDLAGAATLGITTRDGGEGVLAASPWPIAILRVRRSLDTDESLAKPDPKVAHKNGLQTIDYQTLTDNAGTMLKELSPPAVFNMLAMAAPKLSSQPSKDEMFGVDTLTDLFNTCVAAFSLARDIARGPLLNKKYATIHTGRFGAGAFHNNEYAAYVIQGLAAEQVDVDLHYWGVGSELTGAQADYKAIKQKYDPKMHLSDLMQIASDVMKNAKP